MDPRARFDDLRPRSRRSFSLTGCEEVLVAHDVSRVVAVLERAERAVAEGKWVAGFVAYEAAPAFDAAFTVREPADVRLPLAWFAVYAGRRSTTPPADGRYTVGTWSATDDAGHHAAAVDRIRQAIARGDTYQVNHTFRMSAPFEGDPEALYLDLIGGQSCGYGAFIDAGEWAIASASPELFFEWRHGKVTSRPMKGTTARGFEIEDDEGRRARLVRSEKDRAENLMIVDMVRNDIGRVARTGTVAVPELFTAEKYDTVWQLTSTVTAEPRPATTLPDLFGALFPCASITGAPKVATMRLIADLESTPRGVYCGAVGYGGPRPGGPEWAFNVAIRTVTLDRVSGIAEYGTGGGVTYDSTAGGEYREALLKARVLERRTAGFSLLETMRWSPGHGYRDLTAHLERLTRSAWYFDVPVDPAEVRSALDAAVRQETDPRRVRLLVARDGTISTETGDLPAPSDPVSMVLDTERIDPGDAMLRHKTTERTIYENAAGRHPGFDDVVLVTTDGLVADTTVATFCAEIDGTWFTPPVSDGALPGVARKRLVETGRLRERSIPVEQLSRATRVARLNSVRGWEAATVETLAISHPAGQPLRRRR
ncbi:MAG TPA: chorismate-binding protein [Acidimicrobiia bacterium]|nr:chorismate-binding protein [Acidimicrobiia bacterium]